jgi:predicted DNA-binding ribbon-helix-helix protein
MKSAVVKHSIMIGSHKTSVSLEHPFWRGLKDIAADRHVALRDLVATIDSDGQHGNLSSAIRLFGYSAVCAQLLPKRRGVGVAEASWRPISIAPLTDSPSQSQPGCAVGAEYNFAALF